MPAGRDMELLAAWERGLGLDRWRRDDAVLSALGGAGAAPHGLGARNVALLAARNAAFDRTLPLASDCPSCGETCTFQIDGMALGDMLAGHLPETPAAFDWAGAAVTARAPTIDDLRMAARQGEPAAVARDLLTRCVDLDLEAADGETIEAIGAELEALFPAAAIRFDLACPACAQGWTAATDLGEALWSEVQRAAEAILLEVDALARAYGWSEETVLRLSPTRRAAYLQLVEAR